MFQCTVLENGLRIVTSLLPHTRSVSVSFFVGAGSRYEGDEQAGVSHFLEHMLFKGTERRPTPRAISEEIEGVGGVMNAVTDKEFTVYYAKVGDQHFERALDVLVDSLRCSRLEPAEVEKERQVILEELAMTEDSPGDLASLLIDEVVWPDQPLGRDSGGTPASVAMLERAAMCDYLAEQYVPQNTVLAVAGQVNHQHVVAAARRLLADWRPGPFRTWEPAAQPLDQSPRVRVRWKRTEQAHLCLATAGLAADHPDRFVLDVLNTALGEGMSSRLFQEVREQRALAYDVGSYVNRYQDSGAVVISASVDPGRGRDTLRIIRDVVESMRGPVPEPELIKAREYLKGRLQLRMEDSGAVASWLGRQELLRKEILTVEEVLCRLDAVTVEDMERVAADLFRPEQFRLAVVGPYRSSTRFERLLD